VIFTAGTRATLAATRRPAIYLWCLCIPAIPRPHA
jgi:hypothetical protein